MGTGRFGAAFKPDAVAQITERGCPVAEVAQRLWVSQHSLYAWKTFAASAAPSRTRTSSISVSLRAWEATWRA